MSKSNSGGGNRANANANNHSNQMNPNNTAFYNSRGIGQRTPASAGQQPTAPATPAAAPASGVDGNKK